MVKVSVLMAAYNVKEYISEAMASVVAQTLKDIEIVVVDDCSTDGTFEIITEYAKLDSRIRVIRHEKNSGLVKVRQTGLKNSRGEYVIFLDGDDKLTPDACEKAYKAITEENVDMLQFGINVIFVAPSENNKNIENDLRQAMRSADHKLASISKAGLLDEKAAGDIINFTIWDKIYKRSLLEKAGQHIPDEYLNMAEDVLYSFLIHYHAHTYSRIHDNLYGYRFGCGMSTTDELSENLIKSVAKMAFVYSYLHNWVKKAGTEKECELALGRVHRKTYFSIAGMYIYRASQKQKEYFITEIMKYGNAEDLVLGLSEHLYIDNARPDHITEECAGLDIFAAQKNCVKTIGTYYFRAYNGGVEAVMCALTDVWVKAGYNVVLFTDEMPNKNDFYINPSVKRVVLPPTSWEFLKRQDRIRTLRKALIENNVDVMVYNAWVNPNLLLDEMIIKSCGINLIIHTHSLYCGEVDNYDGQTAYYFSSLYRLYGFVDSVVSLTEVDVAWWKALGIRSFKTRNPVQFDINTKVAPLNGHNLLFVGRISEEKQVFDAIMIAEHVKKEIPDVKLTIVGKGDNQNYVNSVNNYIESNKLHDLVNMVGFKRDVLPYYQASDIVLSTSRFEGFGLTLMESKICGVPLVCYELANLDITRECKGMAIVGQSDIKAAAKAVIKILKNDTLKKEMGREARESAEDFLSLDLTEHWKHIFEQSLVPKPKAKPISQLPPNETALRIAVDKYSAGIQRRLQSVQQAQYHAAKCVELDARCAELDARCIELDNRCVELDRQLVSRIAELEDFRRSESFRIGMLITFIPRKLKALLRRIFKRSKD